MARKLFLYKCNTRGHDAQTDVGDWDDFFAQKQPSSWGGTESMAAPLSLKILKEELHVDDMVLCWQTDLRGAVGLCRVSALRGPPGARKIWLEAIDRPWELPVPFTDAKRTNPILGKAPALQPGGGTLFRTRDEEAVEILKSAGSSYRCSPRSLLRRLLNRQVSAPQSTGEQVSANLTRTCSPRKQPSKCFALSMQAGN